MLPSSLKGKGNSIVQVVARTVSAYKHYFGTIRLKLPQRDDGFLFPQLHLVVRNIGRLVDNFFLFEERVKKLDEILPSIVKSYTFNLNSKLSIYHFIKTVATKKKHQKTGCQSPFRRKGYQIWLKYPLCQI